MQQKIKKDIPLQILIVLLIACIATLICSCAPKTEPQSPPREDENLRKANEQLSLQLKEQGQLISSMKLKLLEKHAEVDRLTKMNTHLISEFVRNKATHRSRGDKAETVRLIAEVDTIITTEKNGEMIDSHRHILNRAEKYLADSKSELDIGNVEGAFYLARQALENVHEVQLITGENNQKNGTAFASFEVPLPMKLLETSNVRTGPSTKEKVLFVLGAGETVDAIGYQGQWINVSVKERGQGWIHSSLLN